jgi:hypothetical protein
VLVLGAVVAGIVWGWHRVRDAPVRFRMLLAVSMIGVLLHILMDLPTVYGTRLLSPFDWSWYAVDWMPIVDIYLLIVLIAGMGFGQRSPEARRRNAAIVLTMMAANYGIRAFAHHEALSMAPRLFGPTLPQPCAPAPARGWLLEHWPVPPAQEPAPGRRCLVEIAAMPTFTSPFRWRVIAHVSNAYEVHDLDLLDARFRLPASETDVFWRMTLRYPNVWTPAVAQAARAPFAQTFLGFSRFPAARSSLEPSGAAIVRWNDMRFVGGLLTLDQPVRSAGPFTLTVRVGADGQIANQTLGR